MSKTILSGADIARSVREVLPRRVAVAYLGRDWKEFLPNYLELDAVIVAPVLGTSPEALRELVQCLSDGDRDGWDRVFFLRNLHAKLYLGETSAVWGSANLSKNGLSGEGLVELCLVSSHRRCLDDLEMFFKATLAAAKRQYKTAKAKEQRLLWLKAETRRNPSVAKALKHSRAMQFGDFELDSADDFYICWYDKDFPEGADGLEARPSPDEEYVDFGYFHPTDGLAPGKWVLMWKLDCDYKPSSEVAPHWLMIDDVCPNGIKPRKPYSYTTVAFQRYKRSKAEQPFELTAEVQGLLRRALVEPDLIKPLIQEARVKRGSYFSVPLAQRALPKLIDRMKEMLAQQRLWAKLSQQGSGEKVPVQGPSGYGFEPVSPSEAYEAVFLFSISKSKDVRTNYYEATRYAWPVGKTFRSLEGAIALGIDAQSSIAGFTIDRWESMPEGKKYQFHGKKLPRGHELLGRNYSQVIASVLGFWQRGSGIVVQFDGRGRFRVLKGSATKHWERLGQ